MPIIIKCIVIVIALMTIFLIGVLIASCFSVTGCFGRLFFGSKDYRERVKEFRNQEELVLMQPLSSRRRQSSTLPQLFITDELKTCERKGRSTSPTIPQQQDLSQSKNYLIGRRVKYLEYPAKQTRNTTRHLFTIEEEC